MPLVDGMASPRLGSIATASRRARARALKQPSAIWWEFAPQSASTCRVAPAATAKAWKNSRTSSVSKAPIFGVADLGMFGVGFMAAFASAFLCVRWLLRYIISHDFTVFAWYRIAFGVIVLITAYTGLVDWTTG